MAVLETLGIIVALGIVLLMALGPTLVDLNDRYPRREPRPAEARTKVPARPVSTSARPAHHH